MNAAEINPRTIRRRAESDALAAEMQAGEEDGGWTYTSKPTVNRPDLAYIEVRDETGHLVGHL